MTRTTAFLILALAFVLVLILPTGALTGVVIAVLCIISVAIGARANHKDKSES